MNPNNLTSVKAAEHAATESMFSMNILDNQGEDGNKRVHYLPKMQHKPIMNMANIQKPILEQKREYEKKLLSFDRS